MGRTISNDFSWSKSRSEKFRECLRAYYLHYYRSWGGWDPEAPQETRQLYVLKKLGNRFTWAGSVVHETIRNILISIRFGRPVQAAESIDVAYRVMREDYRHSSRKGYWKGNYRREFSGLVEHEYGLVLPGDVWKANWEAVKSALEWFLNSRWISLAKSLRPEQWLEVDSVDHQSSVFWLDGTKVFAIPDFAFLADDGSPVVVDWKTGRARPGYDDQILGYALYLSERHRFSPERVQARIVYLSEGLEQNVQVDRASLERFRASFQRSTGEMKQLLSDIDSNLPRAEAHFPMTADIERCAHCVFRSPCGRENATAQVA